MIRYIRGKMDTDSQERTIGQIEGFIKNLGSRSTGEARKLLEFFGRLQKFVQYINCQALAIADARPIVYLKKSSALLRSRWSRLTLVQPVRLLLGWRSWLMSACGAAREELNEGWEILIGGEVSSARVADKRVSLDCGPVFDGQLRLGVGEELPPERAKGLWDLRDTGETVYSQIGDHPADPSTNAITRDGDTCAGAEELLSGELVVGTGSREVGDELVTTYKNRSLISNRDWA
jgi:hypothetical protein